MKALLRSLCLSLSLFLVFFAASPAYATNLPDLDATDVPEGATNIDGVLPLTLVSADFPKNGDTMVTDMHPVLTFTSSKTKVNTGLYSPTDFRAGFVYGSFKMSTTGAGSWSFLDNPVFYVASGTSTGSANAAVTIKSPATADYFMINSGAVSPVRDYKVTFSADKREAQVYYCINTRIAPSNVYLFSFDVTYSSSAVWVLNYSDITLYSSEYIPDYSKALDQIGGKLDNLIEQDQQQHEEEMNLLQKIINGITSIPGKIQEALSNLWNGLVNQVTNSFNDKFDSFVNGLKDKLGILYQAPSYFVKVINSITTTETSNELTFPSIKVPLGDKTYTISDETSFQIFPDWIPSTVYTFIGIALGAPVIFGVINYCLRKWEEVTNNG